MYSIQAFAGEPVPARNPGDTARPGYDSIAPIPIDSASLKRQDGTGCTDCGSEPRISEQSFDGTDGMVEVNKSILESVWNFMEFLGNLSGGGK
jgi:hypothetical protein